MQMNLSMESNGNPNYSTESQGRILRIFEEIHNHIYANDGLSPEQCLDEVIKILFLKIYDEQHNNQRDFYIKGEEFNQILKGNSVKDFESRIKNLEKTSFKHFSSLFEKNTETKLKQSTLAFVINKLQSIDLTRSSRDIKGLAFQKFLHSSQRAGRGQFFTPEQVIDLCVEVLDPKPHEMILDPACGSGGFIGSALRYMHGQQENFPSEKSKVFGFEINSRAARIAKMRIFLEGGELLNVIQSDSLSDWDILDLNNTKKHCKSFKESFDVLITNPPFGTQGRVVNQSLLSKFKFGHKWDEKNIDGKSRFICTNKLLNGQVPEILFIERCLDFLKPGGRMAIVLPNGDFENTTLKHVRSYILDKCHISAVIQLPQETFIPSGTGVKTSILFLIKKQPDSKELLNKVFFSQVTKLGYAGNKNGTPTYKKDVKGNPLFNSEGGYVIDEDIGDVVLSYRAYQGSQEIANPNSFLVNSINVTHERFDYEFYKPEYENLIELVLSKNGVPLSSLVRMVKSKPAILKKKDELVRYVELGDISNQYSEIINSSELSVHELPSRASYMISSGQVITSVAGAAIGTDKHASAYVTEEYHGCICTNGFRVLDVNQKRLNPFYLLAFFKSDYFLKQIMRYRTGAAIPSINDSDFMKVLILLPSMEEQNRIGAIVEKGFNDRASYRSQLLNSLNF